MEVSVSDLKSKLKEKLREIFQFEREDLDFGIYRIMNYKRKEIDEFIERKLIDEIRKQMEMVGEEEINKIKEEFDKIKQKIKETLGENAFEDGDLKEEFRNTPLGKEYYEKKKQVENIRISEDLEREIYNHLINFFSRYYDKGDFISKRRYGKNEKYVIPYNGEEVLLYWANKDQYYIKTTEYFRKYTFWDKKKLIKVNFRVIEAEEEKGNIKSPNKKYFVLNKKVFDFNEEDPDNRELNIYFEYRALTEDEEKKYKNGKSVSQEKINEETIRTLEEKIPKNSLARLIFEKEGEKSLIEKHLYRYTRRNTTDYFIHKDLKSFLERELDFYIKNEFLQLEDLQILEESGYFDKLRLYLIGVRVFRKIALKIIEFLAQIENFQKKLWEKKKFVIDTNYVITLDKINEYAGKDFLESIVEEILSNEKQIKEWKKLFGIEIKRKEDLIENDGKLPLDGIKWNKLPIDTKHFNEEFKWKLLVALSQNLPPEKGIDDILDGILIKSENWQALNLLLNKYREKIQTIYIDPPFKTGKDFIYKDNYQTSSWLTLLENRIDLAKKFMKNNASFFIHLDWNANYLGRYLVSSVFPVINEIIWNTNATKDEEAGLFSYKSFGEKYVRQHDTIFRCSYTDDYKFIKLWKPNRNTTKLPIGWLDLISYPKEGIDRGQRLEDFRFFIEKYSDKGDLILHEIGVKEKVFPIGDIWNDIYHFTQSELRTSENVSFNTQKPENLLRRILQSTTEKGDLIMDFFAGSGTTLIVAHKLKRKWIGVELEEYFSEFYHDNGEKKLGLLGRLKVILHGDKEFNISGKRRRSHLSKDINWQGGGFFKYHTLEQYEDALENIEFEDQDEKQQKFLFELPDYFVKYMLEWETKGSKTFLNIDEMKDPFNYKLKIIENYQQKIVNVDLVETFNYLLGLSVSKYKVLHENERKYVFVFGEKEGRKIAIVWRCIESIDFEKDKNIIEENLKDFEPDEIYINGEALVKGFRHIEPLFKSLMFERVK